VCVIDQQLKVIVEQKLRNELPKIVQLLEPYRANLKIVVESTFNWYWLMDGLQAEGFDVVLAHTLGLHLITGAKGKPIAVMLTRWPGCCWWARYPQLKSIQWRLGPCGTCCAGACIWSRELQLPGVGQTIALTILYELGELMLSFWCRFCVVTTEPREARCFMVSPLGCLVQFTHS